MLASFAMFAIPLYALAWSHPDTNTPFGFIRRIDLMEKLLPENFVFDWRMVRLHVIVEHGAVALAFGALPVALHVSRVDRPELGPGKYWYDDRPGAVLFASLTVVLGFLECVSHVMHRAVTNVHWWWAPLKIGFLTISYVTLALPSVWRSIWYDRRLDLLNFVTVAIYTFVLGQLYNAELLQGLVGSPTSFLEVGKVTAYNPFQVIYDVSGVLVDKYDAIAAETGKSAPLCQLSEDGTMLCNPLSKVQCAQICVLTFVLCMVPALIWRRSPTVVSCCTAVHLILQGMYGFFSSDHMMDYKKSLSGFFGGLDVLFPKASHMCWVAHRSIQAVLVCVLLRALLYAYKYVCPDGSSSKRASGSTVLSADFLQRCLQFASLHVCVTVSIMAFGMASFVPEGTEKLHLFILLIAVSAQALWSALLLKNGCCDGAWASGTLSLKQATGYIMFLFATHNALKLWLWDFQEKHLGLTRDRTYPWFNCNVLTVSERYPFRFWHVVLHCCMCVLFALCYWHLINPFTSLAVTTLGVASVLFAYCVFELRSSLPREWLSEQAAVALNLLFIALTVVSVVKLVLAARSRAASVSEAAKWKWFYFVSVFFSAAAFLEPFMVFGYGVALIKSRVQFMAGLLMGPQTTVE